MQGNVPLDVAATIEEFEELSITLIISPPYSTGLHLIEYFWKTMTDNKEHKYSTLCDARRRAVLVSNPYDYEEDMRFC